MFNLMLSFSQTLEFEFGFVILLLPMFIICNLFGENFAFSVNVLTFNHLTCHKWASHFLVCQSHF